MISNNLNKNRPSNIFSNDDGHSQYFHTISPRLLTPGRKSASPTIFHWSKLDNNSLLEPSINDNQSKATDSQPSLDKNDIPMVSDKVVHGEMHSILLKIPTTPTRSKSLSPSLRGTKSQNQNYQNQHPRLRHKNRNNIDHNSEESCYSFRILEHNYKHDKKESEKIEEKSKQATQRITDNKGLKKSLLKKDSINQQIKKPFTLLFNNNASKTPFIESICSKDKIDNINLIKSNESIDNDNPIDKSIILENKQCIVVNFFDNKCTAKESIAKDDACIKEYKLPFNMRKINLNNFPSYQGSKRTASIAMQKIKNANSQSQEKSLKILKSNIQSIFIEKFKKSIERFKKDFVRPAINNITKANNKNQLSFDENSFVLDLIEELKCNYTSENNKLGKEDNKFMSSKRKLDTLKQNDDENKSQVEEEGEEEYNVNYFKRIKENTLNN